MAQATPSWLEPALLYPLPLLTVLIFLTATHPGAGLSSALWQRATKGTQREWGNPPALPCAWKYWKWEQDAFRSGFLFPGAAKLHPHPESHRGSTLQGCLQTLPILLAHSKGFSTQKNVRRNINSQQLQSWFCWDLKRSGFYKLRYILLLIHSIINDSINN